MSILPPADAIAVAERLRAPLERAAAKPVYVECNAVAPATTRRVAEIIAPTGCTFIDGGIVGSPPTEDPATSPTFAVSGPRAQEFEPLTKFGLKMRLLGDSIGQASALKLAYGGIQKGVGAVGLAMILGAAHHGVADELREELLEKQSFLAKWLDKQIDQTFPKAYRFAGEMEEIAGFHEADEGAAKIYDGMALLYEARRCLSLFAGIRNEGRCRDRGGRPVYSSIYPPEARAIRSNRSAPEASLDTSRKTGSTSFCETPRTVCR